MFLNRHIQIRLAKNTEQPAQEETPKMNIPTLEEVSHHAKELGTKAVIGVVAILASAAVLDTASKIVVHKATQPKINH